MLDINKIQAEQKLQWLAITEKSKNQMKPTELYKFDHKVLGRIQGRSYRVSLRLMLLN